jgi:transcriptional regulator with XRE-family HTH domain
VKPNDRLKHERELRGWSQAKLAEDIGTSQVNIGRWERGITVPHPYFREKLCTLFDKDAEALGLLSEQDAATAPAIEGEERSLIAARIFDPTIPILTTAVMRMIGRSAILHQIKLRLFARQSASAISIHGLPGIGKTTLAFALAHDQKIQQHFSDGILWATLGPQPDIAEHFSRWGELVEATLPQKPGQSSLADQASAIHQAIGTRHMLVVIDDIWDLDAALVCKIGGINCAYVVTTRLPGIALQTADDAIVLPELNKQQSLALLKHFVPEIVAQERERIESLIQAVGGHPLALTTIGNYLRVQTYSGQPRRVHAAFERLQQAQDRLQLLEPRVALEHPAHFSGGTAINLQTTIEASERLLEANAQHAFYSLAVLPTKPESFSEEAAVAVTDAPAELLDRLVDSGLIEGCGPGRYALHQILADYARSKLENVAAQKRLITFVQDYIQRYAANYEKIKQELPTILAGLETAHLCKRKDELVHMVCALTPFLHQREFSALLEKHLRRAYQAAKSQKDINSTITSILLFGKSKQHTGDYSQARALYQEGLLLARQHNAHKHIVLFLSSLGEVVQS